MDNKTPNLIIRTAICTKLRYSKLYSENMASQYPLKHPFRCSVTLPSSARILKCCYTCDLLVNVPAYNETTANHRLSQARIQAQRHFRISRPVWLSGMKTRKT